MASNLGCAQCIIKLSLQKIPSLLKLPKGKRIKTLFSFGFGQIEIAPDLDEVHGFWPKEEESEKLSKLPIKLQGRAQEQCEKRRCGQNKSPMEESSRGPAKIAFSGGCRQQLS